MSKLKVLMFVPQYPFPVVGGLEKQAHELSVKLVKYGHDVTILSGIIDTKNKKIENINGVKIFRFKWYRFKLFRFIVTPFYIFHFLYKNKSNYDILHVHQQSWIGLYVIYLAKLFKIPVLTKLPSWGELGVDSIVNSFLGSIKKNILFSSNGILTITKQSIEELKKYNFPEYKIFFCPNGINLTPQIPKLANDEKITIVFVGRLIELKQVDKLIDIWVNLCSMTTKKIELIICGDGPEYNKLLFQTQKITNLFNINFLGHILDIKTILNNSDIFVLPSRVEGNSNAILEAMLAGLPIVSTITGGTPFMVGTEGERFLSKTDDFVKMTNDLLLLIENKNLRLETGKYMRKIIEDTFSMDLIVKKYILIYKSIISNRIIIE